MRRRYLNPIRTVALFTVFLSSGPSTAEPPFSALDFASQFDGFAGCALLLTRDRHLESRYEFGPEHCALPLSPCSTFKVPNAMIGMQEGVVSGPDHLKQWDGTERERPVTNRDHSLATAIEHSVVWYFQDLAGDVGPERMQEWLDRLDYGNRDISGGIDQFWLGNSLRISARQQLELLVELKHETLPFRHHVQQDTQEMLVQDSELPGILHGKTGSCRGHGGAPDHGWFIGWIDWHVDTARNPSTTWFVVNISGDEAWGWKARPIALALLAELQGGD